jgi:hypothetical protein
MKLAEYSGHHEPNKFKNTFEEQDLGGHINNLLAENNRLINLVE